MTGFWPGSKPFQGIEKTDRVETGPEARQSMFFEGVG
jgi:hypothetical protein